MDVGPTNTLRTYARRLPLVQNRRAKTDTGGLLSLLQSGDLTAGIHFPGRVNRWIPIPIAYWATVGAVDFRKLQYEAKNKEKPGTFKIRASALAHEVAQAVSADVDINKTDQDTKTVLLDELERALAAASAEYEVRIPEKSWADYLGRNELVEPTARGPRAGRSEKPSWRRLAVIIGAYLIKHTELTKEDFKIEAAARKIHEIAKDQGLPGLVDWTTIKGALTDIRKASETISIN